MPLCLSQDGATGWQASLFIVSLVSIYCSFVDAIVILNVICRGYNKKGYQCEGKNINLRCWGRGQGS